MLTRDVEWGRIEVTVQRGVQRDETPRATGPDLCRVPLAAHQVQQAWDCNASCCWRRSTVCSKLTRVCACSRLTELTARTSVAVCGCPPDSERREPGGQVAQIPIN